MLNRNSVTILFTYGLSTLSKIKLLQPLFLMKMFWLYGMIFMKDSQKLVEFELLLFILPSKNPSKIQDMSWNNLLNWKAYGKNSIFINLYLFALAFIDADVLLCKLLKNVDLKIKPFNSWHAWMSHFSLVITQILLMDPLPYFNWI